MAASIGPDPVPSPTPPPAESGWRRVRIGGTEYEMRVVKKLTSGKVTTEGVSQALRTDALAGDLLTSLGAKYKESLDKGSSVLISRMHVYTKKSSEKHYSNQEPIGDKVLSDELQARLKATHGIEIQSVAGIWDFMFNTATLDAPQPSPVPTPTPPAPTPLRTPTLPVPTPDLSPVPTTPPPSPTYTVDFDPEPETPTPIPPTPIALNSFAGDVQAAYAAKVPSYVQKSAPTDEELVEPFLAASSQYFQNILDNTNAPFGDISSEQLWGVYKETHDLLKRLGRKVNSIQSISPWLLKRELALRAYKARLATAS